MEKSDFVVMRLEADHVTARTALEVSELVSQLSGSSTRIKRDDLTRMLKANFVAAAHAGAGQIIGLACLVIMDLPQGKRALAESIIVREQYRRQGIGRALLGALVAEAKRQHCAHLSLTCNAKRPGAHLFYKQIGFGQADTSVFRLSL